LIGGLSQRPPEISVEGFAIDPRHRYADVVSWIMRSRALLATVGAIVLAGAAVAPIWLGSVGRQEAPVTTTVVPFELSGLYVTDCGVERSIRPQPASCSGLFRVGGLTASPAFDPFHRAMYYGYLAGELVPCLHDHGFTVETPSRDTVRASSRTESYASLRRPSGSRSGSISSRAVARRIVPSVCTPPASSVRPRGRVNGISVRISAQSPDSAPN
jgi:hypothetical protein